MTTKCLMWVDSVTFYLLVWKWNNNCSSIQMYTFKGSIRAKVVIKRPTILMIRLMRPVLSPISPWEPLISPKCNKVVIKRTKVVFSGKFLASPQSNSLESPQGVKIRIKKWLHFLISQKLKCVKSWSKWLPWFSSSQYWVKIKVYNWRSNSLIWSNIGNKSKN